MIFPEKESASLGKSIQKDKTEVPKNEDLIQCFQGIVDPSQTLNCFNFIYQYSTQFIFPKEIFPYFSQLFLFYDDNFCADPNIRTSISHLFYEIMVDSRSATLYLIHHKFYEIIFPSFPNFDTLRLVEIMLDDDIPPSDLDIREPMPTDKDEYQSKFESSALVQGYSHVCHYYLKNGAAQKLQTLNIKQILHCLLSFGSYYISFQYLRPFLDQVYELIFTDPDIKLKSLCMRILSFYAKKSKAGLFFSLNKPNFPSLFNVNNDMEFVNSLLSFIHRALKQFSYLPHETSLFFIQFVVSLFDCNDDHVSNHAIYAISKGTYGGEIFSEFCLTNLITTKLFQIVYNTNTFEKQTNAVRAICDLFSVSSEVVAEEMAKMGFFQVLHDYFEPTANILMKSLLNAVNKALEIADLNPNFENWKEIIFADDEILNTIEKYAPERGHVGDYSVNSYEVLAYSILMQSMQFG